MDTGHSPSSIYFTVTIDGTPHEPQAPSWNGLRQLEMIHTLGGAPPTSVHLAYDGQDPLFLEQGNVTPVGAWSGGVAPE